MSKLPTFDAAPVIETALSVQFEPIKSLTAPELTLLWLHFKEDFPQIEVQPEIGPVIEQFGVRQFSPARVTIQFADSPFDCRLWFLNESGTELIQVQKDRFIRNWRKNQTEEPYPRYSTLREQFSLDFATFLTALEQDNRGLPKANQCEVTYINVIPLGYEEEKASGLGDVLKAFDTKAATTVTGFEDANIGFRYLLGTESEPLGRLHIEAVPANRASDNSLAIKLALTARGRPMADGLEGILGFFDLAHRHIVQYFADLTTEKMHKNWKRRS